MNHTANPSAHNFAPSRRSILESPQNNMAGRSSTSASTYLETRVLNLEEEHASLRSDVDALREMCHDLSFVNANRAEKGCRMVNTGSFGEANVKQSHQSAMQFKLELEKLSSDIRNSVSTGIGVRETSDMTPSKLKGSVSSHMTAISATSNGNISKSLPPHLRSAKKTNTDDDNK